MSKLYRHFYNEAEDPEVARMEKQRPRGRRVQCMECGRRDIFLTDEQIRRHDPLDQLCDECAADILDDMQDYYDCMIQVHHH